MPLTDTVRKLLPMYEGYDTLQEYNQHQILTDSNTVSSNDLLQQLKNKIHEHSYTNELGMFYNSHKNFYVSFDGNTFYAGVLHISSTHTDMVNEEIIGEGNTELDAVLMFVNIMYKQKKEK